MRGDPARKGRKAMIFDSIGSIVHHSWWTLAIAIAIVYLIVLFAAYAVAHWIGGYRWGLVVERTLGLPILAVAKLAQGLSHILTWPWRHRTHRLFQETFNVSWNTSDTTAKKAVNEKLDYLYRQKHRYSTDSEEFSYWGNQWRKAFDLAQKRSLR